MPLRFYPIALLHTIVVDTHYRKLGTKVDSWRTNSRIYRDKRALLRNWIAVHRANKNSKTNLCELRRIIETVKAIHAGSVSTLSPRETRSLSHANKNPCIL